MATYKLAYTHEYNTDILNINTEIKIYRLTDDQVAVKDLCGTAAGLMFELDSNDDPLFGPIKSLICKLPVYSTANFEFLTFATANRWDYKIEVTKPFTTLKDSWTTNAYNTDNTVVEIYGPFTAEDEFPIGTTTKLTTTTGDYDRTVIDMIVEGVDIDKKVIITLDQSSAGQSIRIAAYETSKVIYTGYNLVSDYSEAYVAPPYLTELVFTDGIAYAHMSKFELFAGTQYAPNTDADYNEDQYFDVRTILDYCFQKGWFNKVDIYTAAYIAPYTTSSYSNYNWTEWLDLKINTEFFRDKTVYEVLSIILKSLGLQLRYSENAWYIFSPTATDRWNDADFGLQHYNPNFGFIEQLQINDNKRDILCHTEEITKDQLYWIDEDRTMDIEFKYEDVEMENELQGEIDIFKRGHIINRTTTQFLDSWNIVNTPNWAFNNQPDGTLWVEYDATSNGDNWYDNRSLPGIPEQSNIDALRANMFYLPGSYIRKGFDCTMTFEFETGAPTHAPVHLDTNGSIIYDDEPKRSFNFVILCQDRDTNSYFTLIRGGNQDLTYTPSYTQGPWPFVLQFKNYAEIQNNGDRSKNNNYLKILDVNKFEATLKFDNGGNTKGFNVWLYVVDPWNVDLRIFDFSIKMNDEYDLINPIYQTTSINEERTLNQKVNINTLFFEKEQYGGDQNFTSLFYQYFVDTDLDHIDRWTYHSAFNIRLLAYLGETWRRHYSKMTQNLSGNIQGYIKPINELVETTAQNVDFILNRYTHDDKSDIYNVELVSTSEFNFADISVPGQIYNLTITDTTINTHTMIWSIPNNDGNTPILFYSIYREAGGFTNNLTKIYDTADNNTFTFTDIGLETDTVYAYGVTTTNTVGESQIGNITAKRTLPNDISTVPNFRADLLDVKSIALYWDTATSTYPITNYNIYREDYVPKTGVVTTPKRLLNLGLDGNTYSYIDNDTDENSRYNYWISASNQYGEGNQTTPFIFVNTFCSIATVPDAPVLGTPSVSAQVGGVILSITTAYDGCAPILWHNVYWSTSQTGPFVLLSRSWDGTFTDFDIRAAETRYYQTTTVNKEGESLTSNIESATMVTTSTPPSAVNLEAIILSTTSVRLLWEVPDWADQWTQFIVYRGDDSSSGQLQEIARISDTEFIDSALDETFDYRYQVVVVYFSQTSSLSNIVHVKTSDVPGKPLNLNYEILYPVNNIKFTWDPPTYLDGLTNYWLFRRIANTENTWVTTNDIITDTTVTISDNQSLINWNYSIRGFNGTNFGDYSTQVNIYTDPNNLPPPQNLTATQVVADVVLNWTVPNSVTYKSIFINRENPTGHPDGQITVITPNITEATTTYTDINVAAYAGDYRYGVAFCVEVDGFLRGQFQYVNISVSSVAIDPPDVTIDSITTTNYLGSSYNTVQLSATAGTGIININWEVRDTTGNVASWFNTVGSQQNVEGSLQMDASGSVATINDVNVNRLTSNGTATYTFHILTSPEYDIIGTNPETILAPQKASITNLSVTDTNMNWDDINDVDLDVAIDGYHIKKYNDTSNGILDVGWSTTSDFVYSPPAGETWTYYVIAGNSQTNEAYPLISLTSNQVQYTVSTITDAQFTQTNTIVNQSLSYYTVSGEVQFSAGTGIVTVNGTWTDSDAGPQNGVWTVTSPSLSGGVVTVMFDSVTILRDSVIVRPEFTAVSGTNYTWTGTNLFEFIDALVVITNFDAAQDSNSVVLTWDIPTASVDYQLDLIWGYVIDYSKNGGAYTRLIVIAGKDSNTTTHTNVDTSAVYDYRIASISNSSVTDKGAYSFQSIALQPDLVTLKLVEPSTVYSKTFENWGLRYYVQPSAVVTTTQTIPVRVDINGVVSNTFLTFTAGSTTAQQVGSSFTTRATGADVTTTLIDTVDYHVSTPTTINGAVPAQFLQASFLAVDETSSTNRIRLTWSLYSNIVGNSNNDNGIAAAGYTVQIQINYNDWIPIGTFGLSQSTIYYTPQFSGFHMFRVQVRALNDDLDTTKWRTSNGLVINI